MTEAMIIEAVRAAGGANGPAFVQQAQQVADPEAVAAFQEALAPEQPSAIPFASQVSETWHAAQDVQQGIVHRMAALSDLGKLGSVSLAQMAELQYEVMNFAFQQEVVTSIAKKASDGITTLVKNG